MVAPELEPLLIVLVLIAQVVIAWLLKVGQEYAKTKGKNLADKEDIAAITRLVEDVKQENALLLEQVKNRGQLRLAAAERRLDAHQKAFALWRRLLSKTHTEENGDAVIECKKWWDENCLYLSPEARETFSNAYHAASNHPTLLQAGRFQGMDVRHIQENWALIMKAGDAIVSGADLPSLGSVEISDAPDAFGTRPS